MISLHIPYNVIILYIYMYNLTHKVLSRRFRRDKFTIQKLEAETISQESCIKSVFGLEFGKGFPEHTPLHQSKGDGASRG